MRLNRFTPIILALGMIFFTQKMEAQCPTEPAELYVVANNLNPAQGDIVCYTVFTRGFVNAITAQFTITFSTETLRFSSENLNLSGIPNFGDGFVAPIGNDNIYRVLWFDLNAIPQTVADDTPLFELCFEVIGDPGEDIQFQIGDNGILSGMEIGLVDQNINPCPADINLPNLDESSNMVPTQVAADCSGGFQVFTNEICGTPSTINEGRVRFDFFCGTAPYSVTSANGTVDNIMDDFFEIDNLSSGMNIFSVSDANGMLPLITLDVEEAALIDIGISNLRNPRCFDEQNPRGEIVLNVSGGTPFSGGEYNYDWGGAEFGTSSTPTLNNIGNGDYTVIIRDSLRCAATRTINLNTTEVTVLPSFLAAECDGVPTGQITLAASGGDPEADFGYRFRLQGTDNFGNSVNRSEETNSANSFTFQNLPAGTYRAWAEDEDLVSMTCDPVFVDITVTTVVGYNIDPIVNPDATATCPNPGDINMLLTLTNTSANPASSFDYTIAELNAMDSMVINPSVASSAGQTNPDIIECLPMGLYQILVEDSDGCSYIQTFLVDGCDLIISEGFTISPDCADPNSGQTTVNIDGGLAPYVIEWPDGEMTQTISNITAGQYEVTVTDANLCRDSIVITVDPADLVTVDINASGSIMCPGGTVDIIATPQGGFAPYTYTWDPDPTNNTSETLTNVVAGVYNVTVTDDTGCGNFGSITIDEPTPPQFNLQDPVFNGCQGEDAGVTNVSVIVNSDFGGDFNFEASSGEMGLSSLSFSPAQLPSGDQWILVTHVGSGCVFDTINFVVPEGEPLRLDTINSDFGTINCFGEEAFVTLEAIGGFSVNFEWPDPINITSAQTFAPAGTYVVTLTSGNCMSIDSFDVVQPDSFGVAVDPFASSPPNCAGDLGTLVANRVAGVDPVDFRWEDASGTVLSNDMEVNGIGPGFYTLFATDANGCMSEDTMTINDTEPVEGFVGEPIQPVCFGDQGQVFIDSVRGGTGPYRYQLETNPAVDVQDTSFASASGNIFIFDINGCRWDGMFTIDIPEEVSVSLSGDQLIELGRSGMLSANPITNVPIDTIIWTSTDPDATFSCDNSDCTEITINPVNDATYTATIINVENCMATADIDVNVNRSQNVYAPNIFTPTSSLINPRNAVFQIYPGSGVEAIDYLRIYDRWGNLVHEEIDLPINVDGTGSGLWDGTKMVGGAPGTPLESGVYIYVFQVKFIGDPAPDVRKGDVTLIW